MNRSFFSLFPLWIFLFLFFESCSNKARYHHPIQKEVYLTPRQEEIPIFREEKKLTKAMIMLDPGHGGDDEGTHSDGKFPFNEKDLTLFTAKKLKEQLEKLKFQVILTRDSDFFIPLQTRASLANGIEPFIFVSIHYNSAPSKEANGVEVYYFETKDSSPRTIESKLLAEEIIKEVVKKTQANTRGIKHGNFHVIRETKVPAVLIEGGFMTNKKEMEQLKNPQFLEKQAEAIAFAIERFWHQKQKKS